MYFFWNSDVLSWMRYMTLYSFRKMNPDWDMVLCLSQNNVKNKEWHTCETQDFFNYKGSSYFNRLSEMNIVIEPVKFPDDFKANMISPVHESDLYRYYKLYNDGGFYSDMDILYFRSMDDIYNEITQCGADTILHTRQGNASIGFLGSKKDNFFYKDLMVSALNVQGDKAYQSYGVELIYSFCGITWKRCNDISNIIKSRYNELTVFIIPDHLVYQYDSERINHVFNNPLGINNFDSKAIGYHWYAGSAIAQKFNNLLTEDNYMNYKTTFSEIAREVLQ